MFHYFMVLLDRHKRERGDVHNWAYTLVKKSNVTVSVMIQSNSELNDHSRQAIFRELPCPPQSTSFPPTSPVRRSKTCTPAELCPH